MAVGSGELILYQRLSSREKHFLMSKLSKLQWLVRELQFSIQFLSCGHGPISTSVAPNRCGLRTLMFGDR